MRYYQAKERGAGFTFIEVLIVIALLGVIAGFAIPFYQSFQVASNLDNTAQQLVSTLRLAQARAMASESLSDFGVHFESQQYVLFKGNSYNPADPFNESYNIAGTLTISSGVGSEVVFTAVNGNTTNTGSVQISTSGGKLRTITINEMGMVDAS